jgi:predicted nucleotidyltransferase component of viral defense system
MPCRKCHATLPGVGSVKRDEVKNLSASVRARLTNLAKAQREDFQDLLSRYARERLLYRLSVSEYQERFILKGALLFACWTGAPHRPTRDLDLLVTAQPRSLFLKKSFVTFVQSRSSRTA